MPRLLRAVAAEAAESSAAALSHWLSDAVPLCCSRFVYEDPEKQKTCEQLQSLAWRDFSAFVKSHVWLMYFINYHGKKTSASSDTVGLAPASSLLKA